MRSFPNAPRRLVLTGFMGCGKTTVGQLLAAHLGWAFADLDHVVEAQQGRTVPDIFATDGEAAFRAAEVQALTGLLRQSSLVIALGGGAPATEPIRTLLRTTPDTAVVHLDAPFPVLYERCRLQALDPEATGRPLLGDRAAAEARHRQRQPLYAAIADHTADASASPERVAEHIHRSLALPAVACSSP